MITIKDDSGTHAKCLLDLFDEEANQLKSAAREVDWERQIAIQLMIRDVLWADEMINLPMTGDNRLEAIFNRLSHVKNGYYTCMNDNRK